MQRLTGLKSTQRGCHKPLERLLRLVYKLYSKIVVPVVALFCGVTVYFLVYLSVMGLAFEERGYYSFFGGENIISIAIAVTLSCYTYKLLKKKREFAFLMAIIYLLIFVSIVPVVKDNVSKYMTVNTTHDVKYVDYLQYEQDMLQHRKNEQNTNVVEKTYSVKNISKKESEYEDYIFTAYCGCYKCCGEWALNRPDGKVKGASGVELISGYHCGGVLPFGTIIETDTGKRYEVQDNGALWVAEKYNNKIIDVYFETHEQAVQFAKQTIKVKLINA